MRPRTQHLPGATLLLCLLLASGSARAQDEAGLHTSGKPCSWHKPFTEASQPDLFYNFYAPNTRGAAAAAYPAPYPTPSLVGHTYYTYQPLMPHEFLYKHHRTYHQYYNQGMGLNRTSVHWYGTPVKSTVGGIRQFFTLPR